VVSSSSTTPRHDHLGVACAHVVLGDHRGLDARPAEQREEAQRDVDHDLDVYPGVVW
jgi:hypothetical protein